MAPALIIHDNPWLNEKTNKKIATIFYDGCKPRIELRVHVRNRMINQHKPKQEGEIQPDPHQDDFVHICFKDLKFEGDDDDVLAKHYIRNVLTNGIQICGRLFLFCGHSNSQLRSRTCYMMAADSHEVVAKRINSFGDFQTINDVRRRARRIGLAFTSADHIVHLNPSNVTTIDDVVAHGRNFTDGCGQISQEFARIVAQKFRQRNSYGGLNPEYIPSAFQIRYQGKKGLLTVVNKIVEIDGNGECYEKSVAFRPSMEKFGCYDSEELYVLDFSKPTGPAHLNAELVSILSSLGIPDHVFESRVDEYFDFIERVGVDLETAVEFFEHKGCHKMAKEMKNKSNYSFLRTFWLQERIRRDQKKEIEDNFERVHIRIPLSRLLYGVCDTTGILQEGQCFVRYTLDKRTLTTRTLKGSVVVGRNPCFHPGDVRVFSAVDIPELHHLVDCIVFSTAGTHPPAAQMSGGDLDGDKYFVSWDQELIPAKCANAFDYSSLPSRPPIPFLNENQQLDLIDYFAYSHNCQLGKLPSLYWDWIRVNRNRAFSNECLALNALYCRCVDGEVVEIPEYLINPPRYHSKSTFILDRLTARISTKARDMLRGQTPLLQNTEVFDASANPEISSRKRSRISEAPNTRKHHDCESPVPKRARIHVTSRKRPRLSKSPNISNNHVCEPHTSKRVKLHEPLYTNAAEVYNISVVIGYGRYGTQESDSSGSD